MHRFLRSNLAAGHLTPSEHHIGLAEEFGRDSLDNPPPDEFYPGSPELAGLDRAEPGCLMAMDRCVDPHVDTWLGDWRRPPRKQRTFFWVLQGRVCFKVDGDKHLQMQPGDWVVFDHRREHMVLANTKWLGAAWQLTPTEARSQRTRTEERSR
jgi:mannose-6-phosphate isomerase-like protein (cupin superfamily)